MLSVNRISKSYGLETVLINISFSINPGERLGLIGPNGCGKTTLLRILTGAERADSGVSPSLPDLRVGYLPQGAGVAAGETIQSYFQHCEGDLAQLSERLSELAAQLGEIPATPSRPNMTGLSHRLSRPRRYAGSARQPWRSRPGGSSCPKRRWPT